MAQPGSELGSPPVPPSSPELECQICYSRFDARARRPKLLRCGHRLCTRCLRRIVAPEDASTPQLRCPFCRQQSPVPGGDVQQLQDDGEALALLTGRERAKKRGPPRSPEVLLCPSVLEPTSSPDCLVVTILEVPEDVTPPESLGRLEVVRLYRPTSLGTLPCHSPGQKCHAWGWRAIPRFILGVLCLLYFSSLPFGIYLLLIEHHSLGIILNNTGFSMSELMLERLQKVVAAYKHLGRTLSSSSSSSSSADKRAGAGTLIPTEEA